MPARCWNTACRTWPARTARRWKSGWPAGVSAAEAEARYLTDEYFENWYQSLCTKLSAYEG